MAVRGLRASFFSCRAVIILVDEYDARVKRSKSRSCLALIRLLNLGPAKHEEGVICISKSTDPECLQRIAGAACCGAMRGHQLGAKDF